LFAANGVCRATVESLFGAEVAQLSPRDQVGAAWGALRFWKPLGVVAVALTGGVLADRFGIGSVFLPLAAVQSLAVVAALLIHEGNAPGGSARLVNHADNGQAARSEPLDLRDRSVWVLTAAMTLFHVAPPAACTWDCF
jgi:hypothetical protein